MAKLHQWNALMTGHKAAAQRARDRAYHDSKKAALFTGLSRTYQPLADDGETLPPESIRVQRLAEDLLKDQREAFTTLFDAELTQDASNAVAKADLIIDGKVLVADCPVTFLLRAERQVQDLLTITENLPVLDDAENWTWDKVRGWYAADPVQTRSEKKVLKSLVLHPGTDRHPPQTQSFNDAVTVGHWTMIKFSGAMERGRKQELTSRLLKLQAAIRSAREQANTIDVTERKCGDAIFSYLLA